MTETEKLDWWMSFRLTRDLRDMLSDCAWADPRARGKPTTMVRLIIEDYLENPSTIPDTAKARATSARYRRRRRLEEIKSLRQDYLELKEAPNPEEELAAQERAEELGMEWPPKPYSEIALAMILSRLNRLWHTDGREGSIGFRELYNSLRRHYGHDQLFACLEELENRNKLRIARDRPIQILEA